MSPEYINESMWMSLNTPVRGRKIMNVGEEEMERMPLFSRGVYFADCYEIDFPRSSCSDHEDYDTDTDLQTLEGLLCRAEAKVEHCHDQSGKN
jgi:hypothetical protein